VKGDRFRRAEVVLEEALEHLRAAPPPPAALTEEQLDLMIAAAVQRELDRRDAERRERFWKRVQKAGWIIAPIAGLTVIGTAIYNFMN
jgi:hypothetical protein